MIPRSISAAFPADVRQRGDEYFSSRRVTISRADPPSLTALVRGTTGYVVKVHAHPHVILGGCTCPYAGDNGVCKHQWATLRQADADGALSPPAPRELSDVASYNEYRMLSWSLALTW